MKVKIDTWISEGLNISSELNLPFVLFGKSSLLKSLEFIAFDGRFEVFKISKADWYCCKNITGLYLRVQRNCDLLNYLGSDKGIVTDGIWDYLVKLKGVI